ncbi:hypothetical protein ACP70R_015672 [Stipagrostis hirtigluma subsp. patula]
MTLASFFLLLLVACGSGATKPEKRIMEGFKRAFLAPWPKTLMYQVI